jgi:PAS domain S-box-containing protein
MKSPKFEKTGDEIESSAKPDEFENNHQEKSQVLLAGEAAVILDRKLKIMGSNETARRLFGQDLVPGEPFKLEIFLQGPHLAEAQAALDNALGKGEGTLDITAKAEDAHGNPFNCLYSVNPLFGPANQISGVLLSFLDADYAAIQPRPFPDQASMPQLPTLGFENLVEQLAEGIFTINSRWRIISFNQTAEKITGYKRQEVLGRFCWEIFRSDLCQSDCPLRITLETGLNRFDQDVRMLNKKGTKLPVLVNTSVIRDSNGVVVGAVESFRPLMELQETLDSHPGKLISSDIIGKSVAMTQIFNMLPDLAASDVNVLIQGESGTGKELIARAIHNQSPYKKGPFVAVNCSALAESLLESELFGHEKAAFTGAVRSKVGRFELARGGTLFLDEIGELKPELQVKLLRVLEQRVFERVGGTRLIPMQARIISATNRDLARALREGAFREDLFYRLRTVPITLPPLRKRPEDIPLLVEHFMARLNKKYSKEVRALDPKVLRHFMSYPWPGNVRELERILEHAYVFVKGPVIFLKNLPAMNEFLKERKPEPMTKGVEPDDRTTIQTALDRVSGRREEAAALLGISRTSLWRKMKQLGLN